jgi:transposase-like protein
MSRMGSSKGDRRPRRRFTDEFMAGAVRLVLDEGKPVGAVARDLDLTPSSLANWVRHARADRTKGRTGLTTAEREELARLRKENRVSRRGARHPETSGGLLREAEPMRFTFIAAQKAEHTVSILCRCLRVTRSGFYAWQRRPESTHTCDDRRLTVRVRLVCGE